MPSTAPRDLPASHRVARALGPLVAVVLGAGLTACTPSPDTGPATGPTAGPTAGPSPASSDDAAAGAGEPAPTQDPAPGPEPTGAVPTPDEHSAVGALAPGFPADLLPLPADAEILVSTWAPQGEPGAGQPYDVSLNVRTALPVADVVALYGAALTAAGFTETVGVPTAGLAAESTYSRSAGAELVTVGVLDGVDARTVSVGGRVHASG